MDKRAVRHFMLLSSAVLLACARSTPGPPAPSGNLATLALESVVPANGARVESLTVVRATLRYALPASATDPQGYSIEVEARSTTGLPSWSHRLPLTQLAGTVAMEIELTPAFRGPWVGPILLSYYLVDPQAARRMLRSGIAGGIEDVAVVARVDSLRFIPR
jgi:hypothetical protein